MKKTFEIMIPKPKTVSGVMQVFNKAIADLAAVEKQTADRAVQLFDDAEAARVKALALSAESAKAAGIRAKLEAMVQA